jgi:hypothetical protein
MLVADSHHLLYSGEEDVECKAHAQKGLAPVGHLPAGLGVVEQVGVVGCDVDHGKLICELCLKQKCGMEGEGAEAYECKALKDLGQLVSKRVDTHTR